MEVTNTIAVANLGECPLRPKVFSISGSFFGGKFWQNRMLAPPPEDRRSWIPPALCPGSNLIGEALLKIKYTLFDEVLRYVIKLISGGAKRGAKNVCPRANFFHFNAVFGKNYGQISGGCKGGAPGAPPTAQNVLISCSFFGKFWQNHRLASSPGGLAPPPTGNSGSAPANSKLHPPPLGFGAPSGKFWIHF